MIREKYNNLQLNAHFAINTTQAFDSTSNYNLN